MEKLVTTMSFFSTVFIVVLPLDLTYHQFFLSLLTEKKKRYNLKVENYVSFGR